MANTGHGKAALTLGAAAASLAGVGIGYLLGTRKASSTATKRQSKPLSSRIGLVDKVSNSTEDAEIKRAFIESFESLLDAFLEHIRAFGVDEMFITRLRKMISYNVHGGKCNRGNVLVMNTRKLCTSLSLDVGCRTGSAIVLGWCIEILQASFLVADDIMDNSITRRGQPCWYRVEEIQLDAVNDSLILESFVFWLIKAEFPDSKQCLTIYDLFRDVTFRTEIGQMMDLYSQPHGRRGPDVIKNFSKHLLKLIVDYKTAFYSFYAPIACSMILTGLDDPEQLQVAEDISLLLGEKFQAQDDFLDCFGDPAHIGKIGTDIQDHKCTWLLVHALEMMTPAQREMVEANLGLDDPQSIQAIKDLYEELKLKDVYADYEEKTFEDIQAKIAASSHLVPPEAFTLALKMIHKRSK